MRDEERQALEQAAARVGDRWTLLVVHALLAGPRRFGELQQDLPDIASNVLSQRLRSLAAEGLVVAEPYQDRPPRYTYALTWRGRELGGVLRSLAGWAAEGSGPRHDACGTAVEARWWCPTCESVVDVDHEVVHRL